VTLTPERRRHQRFTAWLPLRLLAVGGIIQKYPLLLLTQNLSKTGLCLPSPQRIEPGLSIEVEVTFLGVGLRGNNISITSTGHIVRAELSKKPGWHKLAAAFEESPSDDKPDWQKLIAGYNKKS
jgi:hypothetical protein